MSLGDSPASDYGGACQLPGVTCGKSRYREAVCTLGVGVSGPSSLDVGSSPLVSDCTGREVSLSFNGVNRAYYRGHVASTACLLPTHSRRKREISSRALCCADPTTCATNVRLNNVKPSNQYRYPSRALLHSSRRLKDSYIPCLQGDIPRERVCGVHAR